MPSCSDRRPLESFGSRQGGSAWWKLLLGVGAGAALVGLAFSLTSDRALAPEVSLEASNIQRLSDSLIHGYPDEQFAGLSLPAAIERQLVPGPMFRGGGQSVRNAWGLPVVLNSHKVLKEDDGFVITYQGVPSLACEQLAQTMAPRVYDLTVRGKSVLEPDGTASPDTEMRCGGDGGADMAFFFHPNLIPRTGMRK